MLNIVTVMKKAERPQHKTTLEEVAAQRTSRKFIPVLFLLFRTYQSVSSLTPEGWECSEVVPGYGEELGVGK